MKAFEIQPVSRKLESDLKAKIDTKTKPLGALGVLEELALKVGLIQNSLSPQLIDPHIVVFAADHGIAKEGVSAYPQEVTYQMVMNFLNEGAAINVFCKQNDITIKVVDSGVNFGFSPDPRLMDAKINKGTKSFLKEKAMTLEECNAALEKGADIVTEIFKGGCNVIGFGEMGIGNTSSASVLMSLFCQIPIEECVGRGTGLDNDQLRKKTDILKGAINHHALDPKNSMETLRTFGGFEIAMMCGAMLKAAELKMIILIDGFIATSALLTAYQFNTHVLNYCVFAHQSGEAGHTKILKHLKVKPLLNLNMRLGEGTGVAVAYPILKSAVLFLNDMASFQNAGVSECEKS